MANIKAEELRIGNLLERDDEVFAASAYTILLLERNDIECKPVPLTEEKLVEFGFTHHHNTPHPNRVFRKNWTEGFFELEEIINYHSHEVTLKYVHQLQNLYFALTGEELTLQTNKQ